MDLPPEEDVGKCDIAQTQKVNKMPGVQGELIPMYLRNINQK